MSLTWEPVRDRYAVRVPEAVTLVVVALAVARLTGLVVADTITDRARVALIDWLDDRERTLGASITKLITCSWCTSMWVAAVVAPLVWFHADNPWLLVPALVLALSQAAGMMSQVGR